MTPRNPSPSGFTLVELLVATMLLTIVMTAVYTLFFTVIQSWRTSENDTGYHRKARNLIALVQREYSQSYGPAAYLMEGDGEELTLYVLATPRRHEDARGSHLLQVRYRFHQGTLEREEARVTSPLPQILGPPENFDQGRIEVEDSVRTTVARGLSTFSFRYVWMPQPPWKPGNNPPEAVLPLVASHHRMQWGLPQALEIDFAFQDEENPPVAITSRIPTTLATVRRELYQLNNMLGEAL